MRVLTFSWDMQIWPFYKKLYFDRTIYTPGEDFKKHIN